MVAAGDQPHLRGARVAHRRRPARHRKAKLSGDRDDRNGRHREKPSTHRESRAPGNIHGAAAWATEGEASDQPSAGSHHQLHSGCSSPSPNVASHWRLVPTRRRHPFAKSFSSVLDAAWGCSSPSAGPLVTSGQAWVFGARPSVIVVMQSQSRVTSALTLPRGGALPHISSFSSLPSSKTHSPRSPRSPCRSPLSSTSRAPGHQARKTRGATSPPPTPHCPW